MRTESVEAFDSYFAASPRKSIVRDDDEDEDEDEDDEDEDDEDEDEFDPDSLRSWSCSSCREPAVNARRWEK